MRQLLEMIHDDWNSLRDKMEIKIIKKYTSNGRFITIITMCKRTLFAIIFYVNIHNIIISNDTNYVGTFFEQFFRNYYISEFKLHLTHFL